MRTRSYYLVQAFVRRGADLAHGRLTQHASAAEARRAGRERRRDAAGVLVFSIDGNPDYEVWSEPRLIAQHGTVPRPSPD